MDVTQLPHIWHTSALEAKKSRFQLTESLSIVVVLQERRSVIFGCSQPRYQGTSMLMDTAEGHLGTSLHLLVPLHSLLSSPPPAVFALHPPAATSPQASKRSLRCHRPSPTPASELHNRYCTVSFRHRHLSTVPKHWCRLEKIEEKSSWVVAYFAAYVVNNVTLHYIQTFRVFDSARSLFQCECRRIAVG